MFSQRVLFLLCVATASSSAVPPLGYERRVLRNIFDHRSYNETGQNCLAEAAPATTAPKANPWAPLTPEENLSVWNLLHDSTTGLNLTYPTQAKLTDNYMYEEGILEY